MDKDNIKARVTISDVLDYLGIAVRRNMACCPFHQDKRPSLSIKDRDGFWYCFVCAKGGDVIKFVMMSQGITFKESLLWLNDKFSLGLTYEKPKRNDYLEALNLNYQAIKDSLKQEFEANCQRHYSLMDMVRSLHFPYLFWTRDDFTFEITYDDRQDYIEDKLRELENARYKLRRNVTQTVTVNS